jgi:hypothetical protein
MRREKPGMVVLVALAGTMAAAAAAQRAPIAIAPVGQMDCCVHCPFTTPVIASISASDAGGGAIDTGIFALTAPRTPTPHDGWSSYAPLPLTVTRAGRDLHVRIDGPDAENGCSLHARITGVPRGTYVVHLEGVHDMHLAAPMGRLVSAGGELAHATVTVR